MEGTEMNRKRRDKSDGGILGLKYRSGSYAGWVSKIE